MLSDNQCGPIRPREQSYVVRDGSHVAREACCHAFKIICNQDDNICVHVRFEWRFWNVYLGSPGSGRSQRSIEILCTVWQIPVPMQQKKRRSCTHCAQAMLKLRSFPACMTSQLFKKVIHREWLEVHSLTWRPFLHPRQAYPCNRQCIAMMVSWFAARSRELCAWRSRIPGSAGLVSSWLEVVEIFLRNSELGCLQREQVC